MATTFARPAPRGDARAALQYIHGDENERPAAILSDLGDTFEEALAQVEGYLAGTNRKRCGLVGVHSFRDDELDPKDPASAMRAAEITRDLLKRQYGDDTPVHVVTHLDSDSGLVHTHWLAVNHQVSTGKALRANWRIESLRKTNDQLMTEMGPPFVVPEPKDRSLSPAEFYTSPAELAQAADLDFSQLTGATGKEWARARMIELARNPGVRDVADLVAAAPDRGLSIDVRPRTAKSGPVLTVAVIGVDGEPLTSDDGRSKLAWNAKKLGQSFTFEGMTAEIEKAQAARVQAAERAREQAAEQQRIAAERARDQALSDSVHKSGVKHAQAPRLEPVPVVTAVPAATQERPAPAPKAASPLVAKVPLDDHPLVFAQFMRSIGRWETYEGYHAGYPDRVRPEAVEDLEVVAELPESARRFMRSLGGERGVELYAEFVATSGGKYRGTVGEFRSEGQKVAERLAAAAGSSRVRRPAKDRQMGD